MSLVSADRTPGSRRDSTAVRARHSRQCGAHTLTTRGGGTLLAVTPMFGSSSFILLFLDYPGPYSFADASQPRPRLNLHLFRVDLPYLVYALRSRPTL